MITSLLLGSLLLRWTDDPVLLTPGSIPAAAAALAVAAALSRAANAGGQAGAEGEA